VVKQQGGVWGGVLRRAADGALVSLRQAIEDCPPELWTSSLWPVRRDDPYVWPVQHVSGGVGEDVSAGEELLQWYSAFWNVAYHAVFFLDLDLSARELDGFTPPAPFCEADHEAHRVPDRPYSRDELLAYIEHDARKARSVLNPLTDDDAAQAVPGHRHGLRPFAEAVLGAAGHAREHCAQLHMFLGQQRREEAR
jgi:hypothetical protein